MNRTAAIIASVALVSITGVLTGRVLANQSSPLPEGTVVLTPEHMAWIAGAAAGNEQTVLWGDRAHGQHGTLSHYAGGFEIKPHFHTNDMRGLIVAGTWVLGLVGGPHHELPQGSYFFLPGKTAHTDRCKGPSPCTIFLMQEDARDLVPLGPSSAQR